MDGNIFNIRIKKLLFFTIVFMTIVSCKRDDTVTIGWMGALTGPAAPYGKSVKNGVELALSEINRDSIILQIPIYEDDKADAKTGVNAFTKIVNTYQPPVIIQAAASSVMLANIPVAEKNKVVYISPTCSSDKIKDGGDYIFRIWPSDSDQGRFIAEYIWGKLNKKSAAVLSINNDYGIGLANTFINTFTSNGGSIVFNESFEAQTSDFRTQISKIKRINPDIIFVPSHIQETLNLLKQSQELGLNTQFILDAASYTSELEQAKPEITKNVMVVNLDWDADSDDPKIRKFVDAYTEKFKEKPDVYAATGYDCLKIIAAAIKNSKKINAENIKNELYKINYKGVSGNITFDTFGEVHKDYSVYKLVDNNYILVK